MKRRIVRLGLPFVVAGLCASFCGCSSTPHDRRAKLKDSGSDATEEAQPAEVAAKPSKGFFHSTRLPSALSDEASDIEKSLGVH